MILAVIIRLLTFNNHNLHNGHNELSSILLRCHYCATPASHLMRQWIADNAVDTFSIMHYRKIASFQDTKQLICLDCKAHWADFLLKYKQRYLHVHVLIVSTDFKRFEMLHNCKLAESFPGCWGNKKSHSLAAALTVYQQFVQMGWDLEKNVICVLSSRPHRKFNDRPDRGSNASNNYYLPSTWCYVRKLPEPPFLLEMAGWGGWGEYIFRITSGTVITGHRWERLFPQTRS